MKLVMVCGRPGVRRTTVAKDVADRINGRLIRTDVVRKSIIADPEYTDEETMVVYSEIFDLAEKSLQQGHDVVLEGPIDWALQRKRAREVAAASGAEFSVVEVDRGQ